MFMETETWSASPSQSQGRGYRRSICKAGASARRMILCFPGGCLFATALADLPLCSLSGGEGRRENNEGAGPVFPELTWCPEGCLTWAKMLLSHSVAAHEAGDL
jgi:hypothetical protein